MSVFDGEPLEAFGPRRPHATSEHPTVHPARWTSTVTGRLRRFATALPVVVDLAMAFVGVRLWGSGPVVAVMLAVAVATAVASDRRRRGRLDPGVLTAVRPAIAGGIGGFAAAVLLAGGADSPRVAGAALVAVVAVLASRVLSSTLLRRARRRGHGLERTVIIGAGGVATSIARLLRRRPEFGLSPVGFVDDPQDVRGLPLPLLGPSSSLGDVVRRHGVTRAVIAYGCERELDIVAVLRASHDLDLQVYVLPRFFELGTPADGRATDELWGFPLVPLRRPASRRSARRVKRVFDVVVGGALLLITAPVMAVVALLVRASSSGPALFRQERIGLEGRPYELLKFRSMRINDDSETQWSVDGDDRVTAVGRVLRRTHLDELPQLWNVLRGDMSLVGPRPERAVFVDRFTEDIPGYRHRHRVPTGLTGLAQVNGLWGDTSIEERARFDNLYIEQWSVTRDLGILLRTAATLMGRREDEAEPSIPRPASARSPREDNEAA